MTADNRNCRDCVYFGGGYDESCTCNYIFVRHTHRPCPPGDACTVKILRRRRRRMKAENLEKRKTVF